MVAEDGLNNKKIARNSKRWLRWRQAVQVLALLLFLYLLLGTRQGGTTFLPHDLFFRLDPLAGMATMLASRSWIAPMALGGVTLLLTLAVGRAWCSWLCPLGTLLDWTPARHSRQHRVDIPACWRQVKYFLLLTVLVAAIAGSLTLLVLEPITLLFRTVTSVVLPTFSFLVTAMASWLYRFGPLQPGVSWFDNLVRGSLLTEQSFFLPNLLLAAVFGGVLALNAVQPRFWCRCFCPLGGLLGLVSKVAQIRYKVDVEGCTSCQNCAIVCPTGAIDPERKFAASSTECTTCLDCVETCPTRAITFSRQWGLAAPQRYEPARRQFLASLGVAVIGAGLLRMAPFLNRRDPKLIRPPGSSEEQLQNKCLRCGECVRVCPTGGLQPSQTSSDWDKVWTPVLVSRHGYCDYSCTSCGQVCPSGAITELSLAEKRQTIIGVAAIDEERCIPFAEGRECIVCEEMCPVPQKAILLEEQTMVTLSGDTTTVRCPQVVRNLCIGCGICEYQCPVDGESAIRIYATDEQAWY